MLDNIIDLLFSFSLRFFACPYCAADNAARSNVSTFESIITGGGVLILSLIVGGFVLIYTVNYMKKGGK